MKHLLLAYTKYERRGRLRPNISHLAPRNRSTCKFKEGFCAYAMSTKLSCADSPEPLLLAYTKNGSRGSFRPKNRHIVPMKRSACEFVGRLLRICDKYKTLVSWPTLCSHTVKLA